MVVLILQIGNALMDDETTLKGIYDYWWTHGINSDATHDAVFKYCFGNDTSAGMCINSTNKATDEMGDLDIHNIYAPICLNPERRNASKTGSVSSLIPINHSTYT